MTNHLEIALLYAARGWPVLALHALTPDGACGCRGAGHCSPGKHPRWRHGLKEATTDTSRIRGWGKRWEDSNLGIRTGAEAGLFVLDIDPRHGGDQTLRSLEQAHGTLPRTIECLTGGGGRHLYFAHPGGSVANSSGRLGASLDVRADGGYVVAPPSTHVRGVYQWKVGPQELAQPAAAPPWLLARLNGPSPPTPTPVETPAMVEGQRNERMFSLAGTLRKQGMDRDLIEALLLAVNARCCQPPLSVNEVRTLTQSIMRYPSGKKTSETSAALLTRLSDIEPSDIHWLWPGRIPLGKLTLIAGDPGLGKSLVTLDMAARVSTARPWPDAPNPQHAGSDVVLLAAEDDLADTVRPRLDKAGADGKRIHVLTAVRTNTTTRPFNLVEDLEHLRHAMGALSDTRLVIIDPITAYLGDAEEQSNTEIRAILAPLSELAAQLSVAVVAVTHLRKSGGKAIYRAMGSLAFTAAARAVWGIARDPDMETRQLFVPIKMNIGPQPTALAYAIDDGPVVTWDATEIEASADGVFGDKTNDSALNEAVDYLAAALADGPRLVRNIEAQAKETGISKATLKRARKRLDVRTRKDDSGGWMLSLHQELATQSTATTNPQMELPFIE